jgi:hypothetical protein
LFDDGCSPFSSIAVAVQAAVLLSYIYLISRVVMNVVQLPVWVPGICILFFSLMTTGVLYQFFLWDAVLKNGDLFKLIVGVVVNPLFFEDLLTYARVLVRTVQHAHESTIVHTVTITMALKKMCIATGTPTLWVVRRCAYADRPTFESVPARADGRFIIGMIQSQSIVAASSVLLGMAGLLVVLPRRSRPLLLPPVGQVRTWSGPTARHEAQQVRGWLSIPRPLGVSVALSLPAVCCLLA